MPATAGVLTDHGGAAATAHAEGGEVAARPWHALWTHSHREHLVHHQLAAKGFELVAAA